MDVVLAVHEMGLGGTERAALNHALAFDRARVRPRIVELQSEGVRRGVLEEAGIPVNCAHRDEDRLAELLDSAEVVHVYRAGFAEPAVPRACRRAGVGALVETNVFGFVDTSPDEPLFACHLFMSQMCASRYRQATGLALEEFHRRHRVAYNPIDVDRLRGAAPRRREAKRQLGLDPERPVVGRLGRADDRKWSVLLIDMVPRLLELRSDAQLLFVGATDDVVRRLRRRGVLDRVVVADPVAGEESLATLYAACDVFASTSSIGESFGVAIAEALALGVPVVTSSTPWTDNAQVELVETGVNGYVANHPRSFAQAIAALLDDEELRARFGRAAAGRAASQFSAAALTRQLEALYMSLLRDGRAPRRWTPSLAEFAEFERDYPRRARAEFRPLTVQERAGRKLRVGTERGRWLTKDLRKRGVRSLSWNLSRGATTRLRALGRRARATQ